MDPRRSHRTVTGTVAALALGLVALAAGSRTQPPALRLRADPAVALLAQEPATRFGFGGLHLDGDLATAIAGLGPADHVEDDMIGPGYVWELEGAELHIGVWAGTTAIGGLTATVAPGAASDITLHGGLRLGDATLGEVLDRWGPPDRRPLAPHDDFVAAYDDCFGAFPIVTKLDQRGQPRGAGHPAALDVPITSVLTAYADEAPGTHGCPVLGPAAR